MSEDSKTLKSIYAVIIVVAIGFVLKAASSVTLPLAISLFMFMLVNPLVNRLEKLYVPRWIAIIIAMLLILIIFVLIVVFVTLSLNTIIDGIPKYSERIPQIFGGVEVWIEDTLNLETELSLFESFNIDWQGLILSTLSRVSGSAVSIITTMFLVFIFVLFLLLERRSLIPKLRIAIPSRDGFKLAVLFERVNRQISRYLLLKSLISLTTGFLFYLAAMATGLDFPFVWGVLAFIFNFIPSIGSVVITLLTILMAILQFFPNYVSIIYVAVLTLAIQTVLGNIIDPRMQGRQLNLSPFVILVSLVFWGYIWGIVGMFLAVPLTSIIQIIFANIKQLKPIAILIGSGKPYRKKIKEEEQRRREKRDRERDARRELRHRNHRNNKKQKNVSEMNPDVNAEQPKD